MSRYPRDAGNSLLTCHSCDGPVVKTTEERFVCADCGDPPVESA